MTLSRVIRRVPAVGAGAGLVEPDVAGPAYSQELEVQPARFLDGALVCGTEGRYLLDRKRAVGDVRVGLVDVDVIEQVLVHEPPIALQVVRLHGEVLVQIERQHALEAQALLLVQANQLGIDAGRGGAGRQAQDTSLPGGLSGADKGRDFASDRRAGLLGLREDLGGDPFPGHG